MKRVLLILVPVLIACGPYFYQAPPPLGHYPERIPTKSWQRLLEETQPLGPATKEALIADCRGLTERWAASTREARLTEVDRLRDGNRSGEFDARLANLLLEMRELAELEIPSEIAASYLGWRVDDLELPHPPARQPQKRWDENQEEFLQRVDDRQAEIDARIANHDRRIASSPHELLPFELVRRAATRFRLGDLPAADADFAAVIVGFPDHPRAEVARFMTARCALVTAQALERELRGQRGQPGAEQVREKDDRFQRAEDRFREYLQRYPQGRFAGDATGWLGAIALGRGEPERALDQQLRRLDLQSTREVMRSVLRESDQLIQSMIRQAGEKEFWDDSWSTAPFPDFELLARHSQVARLFVYHCLDPASQVRLPIYSENESGDRGTLEFLRRNITRPDAYTRQCLRMLADAVARHDRPLDPTSLLILGWAATREGDHGQALVLFDRALAAHPSDELLHARAIALSRLGRHADSAASFQSLFDDFPDSPLTPTSRFDHALELHQAGQSGEALIALLRLDRSFEEDRGWKHPDDLYLHPENELPQWIDSIAQFAPLNEFVATLESRPPGDPYTGFLRSVARARALCEEDFATASELLDGPDASPLPTVTFGTLQGGLPAFLQIPESRWQGELSEIVRTARSLRIASPRDPRIADLHLRHARQWEDLRGKLTLPLHAVLDYSGSESWKLDQLRRANGRFLGIPEDQIDAALESRDELRHALRHYLIAAEKSKDPDVVAPALEGANRALFRMAEFSPYAASRAAESGHTELSARLVDRLQSEFPDRPETARAVRWTFVPLALLGEWMPGDYNMWNSDSAIAQTLALPASEREADDAAAPAQAELQRIEGILQFLVQNQQPIETTRAELAAIQADFNRLRPRLDPSGILPLADHLDDLRSAAAVENLDPAVFRDYAETRLKGFDPPPAEGVWLPLADHLEFLRRIHPVQDADGWLRPRADTIPSWKEYLARYPDGAKAEPASLRLIRLQVRAACPIPHVRAFHFPESPIANGYKRLVVRGAEEASDAESLRHSIAAHRAKFPGGRYEADLLILEGAVAARANDFPTAVANFVQVLTDPAHPELLQDSSLYFSHLCLRLLEPEDRPTLAAAFRANPKALELLDRLANGDTCVSRLRPMLPWLRNPGV